jgi:hypothetical protein
MADFLAGVTTNMAKYRALLEVIILLWWQERMVQEPCGVMGA